VGITHRSAAKDVAVGVFNHLNSTSAFEYAARLFRTYVPQGTTAPYVVVQNITENDGWSTPRNPAKDCTFQVRVVSQQRGEAEAADILSAAIGRVMSGWGGDTGARMAVPNHTVPLLEFEGSEGFEEDIGGTLTFTRVGRFRVQVCQST